jgi:two-component system alkaline phosphatase synthesis response regulator PhoP
MASGYIAKPFEKDELIANVKKILSSPSETIKGQKVLVVDDEPDVVQIISEDLKNRGLVPLEAFDGQEAIEKARQEKPDLIILDIRMPKRDGFEVMNVLGQDQKTWSIPIIVLTGASLSEKEKERIHKFKGVSRFFLKPFEPDHLIKEVERVLCEKKKS